MGRFGKVSGGLSQSTFKAPDSGVPKFGGFTGGSDDKKKYPAAILGGPLIAGTAGGAPILAGSPTAQMAAAYKKFGKKKDKKSGSTSSTAPAPTPPAGEVGSGGSSYQTTYGDARKAGMLEGESFGDKYFGGGKSNAQQQQMVGGLMDAFQGQAADGMGSAQFNSIRNRATQGIDQQAAQQMQTLNAQQGASGVRGAAGMAQKQNMLQSNQMARGDLENKMLAEDLSVRERGQASLQDMLAGERAGKLSAMTGMGNLNVQDLASMKQDQLADKQAIVAQDRLDQANRPTPDSWLENVSKGKIGGSWQQDRDNMKKGQPSFGGKNAINPFGWGR